MTRSADIQYMTEYIKNVLYFATVRQGKILKNTTDTHFFCIDNDLIYENFYSDFGPLNLGCVYKYCKILNEKLKQISNKQAIVYYTSNDSKKKVNAAFLLGCFGILYLNLTPTDALKPLLTQGQSYRPFQDASPGDSAYTISLLDCLQAIKKARELGFFNFQDFNCEEYDRLNNIYAGDLNWIIPGKFLAFIGPVNYRLSLHHPPEMYIDYFQNNGVKIVIRLNKKLYDENVFHSAGIDHCDLYFPDGSYPPRHIVFKFLRISEESDCAIAVHCKAGLGRTGSLIGVYLIKHYRMTAREAIGWMRICRPGSVIGHQQEWLERVQQWLIKQGNIYRNRLYQNEDRFPIHEFGVYSIAEKALQQRPVVFHKSSTMPGPIQRQTRSDLSPPNKTFDRDTLNLPPEKKTHERERRVIAAITHTSQHTYKGDDKDIKSSQKTQRCSGSGEPRLLSPTRRANPKPQRDNTINDTKPKKITTSETPVPSFRTSHGSVIKTINDARNFLMRSTINRDSIRRQVNTTTSVVPHFSRQSQYASGKNTPSSYSTASKSSTQPQNRRRLGRSPSPPRPKVTEHSRATNTTSSSSKFLAKDASKTALREALSRLKLRSQEMCPVDGNNSLAPVTPRPNPSGTTVVTTRDGSMGAASVGAASLGARREAPAPRRAPSVRSDERPLATQGDMLNSIKFQRKFRDTFKSEKMGILVPNKLGLTVKERTVKNANSKSSIGSKPSHQRDSVLKERSTTTSRGLNVGHRPSSPKGRRNTNSTCH